MNIRIAEYPDALRLENFLVFVNGEENRTLAKDYIKAMFSDSYRRPTFVMAEEGEVIMGAAAFSEEIFTVQMWGISWVSVAPEYRNKGLGQKLVQECLDHIAHDAGKTVTVILNTYPNKTRLYEKAGFVAGNEDHMGGAIMTKVLNANH